MSNGHCLESGMPGAGEVIVDQPSSRSFTLLDKSAGRVGTIKATKIAYATMTDTDVSLYETSSTYAQIEQKYGIKPLELATAHPAKGAAISVVSGYWKKIYSCNVDGFVHHLKEGDWTWKDSVRYTPDCKTIGGTSGSPVIDTATGKVAAINNTGNEDGEKCTVNNPCEVDENGNVTVHQGINYAQETYGITEVLRCRQQAGPECGRLRAAEAGGAPAGESAAGEHATWTPGPVHGVRGTWRCVGGWGAGRYGGGGVRRGGGARYGRPWTWAPTWRANAPPPAASQLVDQVIAPRRPG